MFNSIEDVWKEIYALCEKWKNNKYSLGRNLYFHLPLFCNPKWLVEETDVILLQEYAWVKDLNIPLARSLGEANARTLDYFDLIGTEVTEIKQYVSEKNGSN